MIDEAKLREFMRAFIAKDKAAMDKIPEVERFDLGEDAINAGYIDVHGDVTDAGRAFAGAGK